MNSFYPLLPMVLADGMELPTYAHDGDAALDLSVTEDGFGSSGFGRL